MNAGKQIGVVETHELTQSQGGTWGVKIKFDVEGEPIFATIWLSDKAMRIARKSLKAIGFDPDNQNVADLDKDKQLLAGAKAELDIQEEAYNGETRLKVAWINPIPKLKSKDEMDALTAKLRAVKKDKKDDLDTADPLLPGTEQAPEGDVPF